MLDPWDRDTLTTALLPAPAAIAWGHHRRDRYRRMLAHRRAGKDLGELPFATEAEIIAAVTTLDPDLATFREMHRDFEVGRSKISAVYELPKAVAENIDAFRRRIPDQKYSLPTGTSVSSASHEVAESVWAGDKLTILVRERQTASLTHRLDEEAFEEVRAALGGTLPQDFTPQGIVVRGTVAAICTTRVVLDFENGRCLTSTDSFRVGDEQYRSSVDPVARTRSTLAHVLEACGLANHKRAVDDMTINSLVTRTVVQKLRMAIGPRRLCVTLAVTNDLQDSGYQERIKNTFRSQHVNEIARDAKKFYGLGNTFDGFRAQHHRHCPDIVAKGHIAIQGIPNIEESACCALLFYLRRPANGEPKYGDMNAGHVVDYLKYEYDPDYATITGSSKDDSEAGLDELLSAICEFLP